jgi:hypothetical protein
VISILTANLSLEHHWLQNSSHDVSGFDINWGSEPGATGCRITVMICEVVSDIDSKKDFTSLINSAGIEHMAYLSGRNCMTPANAYKYL